MTTSPALAATGIRAGYGARTVLHDVSITCPSGTVTGLIGPNGSGKSTLAKVLAGVLTPFAGEVRLDGEVPPPLPSRERARRLAYLPQQANCQWPLTVHRLASLGRLPHLDPWMRPGPEDAAAIDRALAATDMLGLQDRAIHHLSGGEALRAHLARVLAGEPGVIIADEPLAGLDLYHQLQALELLQKLAHKDGRTVLLVLHDLSLAARVCDRLVLLAEGRVSAAGSARDVLQAERLCEVYGVEVQMDWSTPAPVVLPLRRIHPGPSPS